MAASEGPLCVVTYVYGLEECLLVLGRKKGREVGREDGKRAERKDRMKGKTGPGGVVRRGKKADKSATPTIPLKLQVHDTLSPDMREHVHHLRINGSCSDGQHPPSFFADQDNTSVSTVEEIPLHVSTFSLCFQSQLHKVAEA